MKNRDMELVNGGEVRERILSAARRLFVERGYNGTSIRDIASESQTNVAMVNYYFKSKYNLFEIIFEEALDVLISRVFGILRSDLPFFELVEEWIDSYYEVLQEYPQIPIFILTEVSQNPQNLTRRITQRDPFTVFEKISQRIEIEYERGTIRYIPPLHFLLNVLSLCIFPFMFERVAIPVADKSTQEYGVMVSTHKKYVVDFVKAALRPQD